MAEILVDEGIIDESTLAELEQIVASRLRHGGRLVVKGPVSPATAVLFARREFSSDGTAVSATVAYVSPVRADGTSGPGIVRSGRWPLTGDFV